MLPPSPTPSRHDRAILAWMHDFAPYGVITTDTNFCVQSWNHWMENHSGKAAAEVLRRSLFTLYPDLRERGLTARFERSLAGEISLLSTALHGYLLPMLPTLKDSEFEQMQQTARIAPLHLESEIVGTIIVIEDVTQRESQSLLLRRQHERESILSWALAHLLESVEPRRTLRELFCKVAELSDFDCYFLYLFPRGDQPLQLHAAGGITPELEQALAVLDKIHPLYALLTSTKEARSYEALEQADGAPLILHQRFGLKSGALLPLNSPEGPMGWLCFGSCVRSELKEGELELISTISKYLAVALHKEATHLELRAAQAKLNQHAQELETQVNERTAKLREIIGELETFSYSLAHDLRAPIRALTGYSEVLSEDYASLLPKEAQTLLERQHRACKQLDGMTKDLLEFSRVSRQDIQLSPVRLNDVVNDVLALLPAAKRAVTIQPPLHRVLAHRGLLQQCLANLIDNALKFVGEGKPAAVRVWTERTAPGTGETDERDIVIRSAPFSSPAQAAPASPAEKLAEGSAPASRIRIVVQDEGIGIPAEAHAKIFGIFERGTSSGRYEGSGIGLAIVARAVQRMGGSCGVESQPGAGSRFWLELLEA